MKQKLINWMLSCKNATHFIRLIVGGYVVYLGGQVIYSAFVSDDVTLILGICAALVALAGLAIMAVSGWAIACGYSLEYQGKSPWTAMDEADETDGEDEDEAFMADTAGEADVPAQDADDE